MATVNIGNQRVLFITIHNGSIWEIKDEGRSVYENSKGRFIKHVSTGQVWLDDENRAVLAYNRWRKVDAPPVDVLEKMLHDHFTYWRLTGFIK